MSARRSLLLLAFVPLTALPLLPAAPALSSAAVRGDDRAASRAQAVALLTAAARAARTRSWSGVQQVSTWSAGTTTSAVVRVAHVPERGTSVWTADGAVAELPESAADAYLMGVLTQRYDLQVTGGASCSGRPTTVVEARRPEGQLAARFWLDDATGLALRREVFDGAGRRLRASTYTSVEVPVEVATDVRPVVARTAAAAPAAAPGWDVPRQLPGGFALYDAGRPASGDGAVLQLAYSDGLSTVSVFSQPGRLGDRPIAGWTVQAVDGSPVWVRPGVPEQLVFAGGGQVFTVIGDAGHEELLQVVRALPHDVPAGDGTGRRMARGLARVGGWLNPFD